ncbi:hypothetical protein R1sor_001358 [Riccia sorocarpa]|uniref:CCHC-type domain-containing protein n=1 Tax=Riccia sorocarpa TaxID=122646 RepID=A0ABD3GZW9_9MARC
MVEALGPVLFHSTHEANDIRYAHLRACVMRQDTENLPNAIIVDLPWGGHFVQEVKYTRLPDACYTCNQKGHKAFECPQNFHPGRRGNRSTFAGTSKDAENDDENQEHDVIETTGGTTHTSAPNIVSTAGDPISCAVDDLHNMTQQLPVNFEAMSSQKTTEIDLNLKTTSASSSVDTVHEDDLHDVTQTQILSQSAGHNSPEQQDNASLHTPFGLHRAAHTPLMQRNSYEAAGSPLSPLEHMIVAKKCFLDNGKASPHEEAIEDAERRSQHKQNRPMQEEPPDARPHQLLMTQMLKWASIQGAVAQGTISLNDEARLAAVAANTNVLVDYTVSGRGGAALLVPQQYPILDHGTSGTGNAVWALVNTKIGLIKIISIHAPNTKAERTILWDRMQDIIGDGRWIMAGDFNMVELYEDSKGKSALVSGAEARSWKYLAESKGLIAAYLCDVTTTGGFFTRQAFCGLRYDRARLDRIYVSEGAEWLELVKEVSHKSDQVVSDHVPVTFDCRLKSDGDQGWRPKTYFKMGPSVLYRPGIKQKAERTILWDRMQDIIGDGRWIMAGDFNMVELYEDSKGKSALVSGAEARSWKYLAESKGLIDAYLCAVTTTGGLFTRQAFCGLRYDRARLDRIYVSEGAEWLELVKEVSHKSDQVVSDHVPVTFDCRLKSDGDQGWRPKTYFKMGPSVLYRPGIKQKAFCGLRYDRARLDRIYVSEGAEWLELVKEVSHKSDQVVSDHVPVTFDCRLKSDGDQGWRPKTYFKMGPSVLYRPGIKQKRKWELGWIRVREVLRQEKRKMDAKSRQCHDLRLQVLSLRMLIEQEEDRAQFHEQLIAAEDALRRMEQADAKAWRTRSKVKKGG